MTAVTRRRFLGATSALAAGAHRPLWAETEQLRIVVPNIPGNGIDLGARLLAQALTSTGRRAFVENKPGAGGVLGAMEVARSRADGSAVLYATGGHSTNAVLMKKLPFDPIADFTPITLLFRSSGFALLVGSESRFRSLEEFVAQARTQPGRLSFGSSGVGNTTHVMGALFCKALGIELLHVPFKGTPFNELRAGTVDAAFLSPSIVGQQIRAGHLHALAISGERRSALVPHVPTFSELGLHVEDLPAWSGVLGPAGLHPDVAQEMYLDLARASEAPQVRDFVRENGGESALLPPEQFRVYLAEEIRRLRRVLPPLGIEMG